MATYDHYKTAAEFDAGYDNFITPDVVAKWDAVFRADSERILASQVGRTELRYGRQERNAIDFFPAQELAPGEPAPMLIAVHGGLWFLLDKYFMHFLAEAFTRQGVHVAAINYCLAPGQDLRGIMADCRDAVVFLFKECQTLQIDPARISVLGHSAAGQIVALLGATIWRDYLPDAPRQILHGCVGVSGFFDIEPFADTHFHAFTKFPIDQYREFNPLQNITGHLPRSLLISGGEESSLILQMMAHYAAGLRAKSVPVETICAEHECHFSVLHKIGDPNSHLFERVLQLVRGL